ncbi:MAG: TetR/AcrR family transcriptional regulator, partial [Xanthomonadaceae bacterium]|nr:TetR/AcrR family transcriptional regulator [Xanthomonadaceae bacterium]
MRKVDAHVVDRRLQVFRHRAGFAGVEGLGVVQLHGECSSMVEDPSLRRIFLCSRTYSAPALGCNDTGGNAMPYSADHKQRTRALIVECARTLFNRKGFIEVSIDEIMASAGLTRGGFYNHFKTKEE